MHLDAGYELRYGATVNWEVQNLDGSDGLWQSMAVYGSLWLWVYHGLISFQLLAILPRIQAQTNL